MTDLNIVVAGASGRMGRTLVREIAQAPDWFCPARWKPKAIRIWAAMRASWQAWRRTVSSSPPILCP